MAKRFVIIGDGAAGTTAAQYIRQRSPQAEIQIYADDPDPAYYRAALTNYLMGELRTDQLFAVPPNFYDEFNIRRTVGRVSSVDTERSQIHFSNGRKDHYDYLLIAAGSRSKTLEFPGADLSGVMTLRTLQDAQKILDQLKSNAVTRAVIVGGGPLALEWTQGLREHKAGVTLLLRGERFMEGALDQRGSDLVLARLREAGVEVLTQEEVKEASPNRDGDLAKIFTKNKTRRIDCQMLGLAVGTVCNSGFLKSSALLLDPKNGAVLVDNDMRTNVENVFAAGDIARVKGKGLLQLWEPARLQGRVAAFSMTGGFLPYDVGVPYHATRLYDLDFGSIGQIETGPGLTEKIASREKGTISYRKVVLQGGKLVGALMLGRREEKVRQHARLFKKIIDKGLDVSSVQDRLLDPEFDLGEWVDAQSFSEARPASAVAGEPLSRLLVNTPKKAKAREPEEPQAYQPKTPPKGEQKEKWGRLESSKTTWAISQHITSVGRDADCTVSLEDRSVSQNHAQLASSQQGVFLRDVGSSNGTWVNGVQVTIPRKLRNGDVIKFGRVELTFRSDEIQSSAPQAEEKAIEGAYLIIRSDRSLGVEFQLKQSPAILGRNPECQLWVDSPSVSSKHAELFQKGERWFFKDLNSSNGSYQNETRLSPEVPSMLSHGDQLRLGRVLVLFQQSTSAQAPQEKPRAVENHAGPNVRADRPNIIQPIPSPEVKAPSIEKRQEEPLPPKKEEPLFEERAEPPKKVAQANDTGKCSNCGRDLRPGARFCPKCKTPVAR